MKLIHWDCLEEMDKIESESIDLVVTSPPYDNLRTYNWTNDWSFEVFKPIAKELARVIKKGWVIVWVVWDSTSKFCESMNSFKQAIYFKDECWLNLLDTMIYYKQNYAPAYPTLRRYSNQFEYMFIFSKWKPNTFNPVQVKKIEDRKWICGFRTAKWEVIKKIVISEKNTKNASNVWSYPVWFKNLWHPAVFPEKLAEDHILSWSNPWNIVLDPFMWSWTTGKMAKLNNRDFIWIERVKEYYNIACDRINNNQI